MNCSHCGYRLPSHVRFCAYCGTEVLPLSGARLHQRARRWRWGIVLGILGGGLLLIAGAIGVWLGWSDDTSNPLSTFLFKTTQQLTRAQRGLTQEQQSLSEEPRQLPEEREPLVDEHWRVEKVGKPEEQQLVAEKQQKQEQETEKWLGQQRNAEVQKQQEDEGRKRLQQAQKKLSDLGFKPGPIDGILGPQTQEALRQYQVTQGLPVTGFLDEATWKTLMP